jgi:hypothetical protein
LCALLPHWHVVFVAVQSPVALTNVPCASKLMTSHSFSSCAQFCGHPQAFGMQNESVPSVHILLPEPQAQFFMSATHCLSLAGLVVLIHVPSGL